MRQFAMSLLLLSTLVPWAGAALAGEEGRGQGDNPLPLEDGFYTGETSQGQSVSLSVSGGQVVTFQIWVELCTGTLGLFQGIDIFENFGDYFVFAIGMVQDEQGIPTGMAPFASTAFFIVGNVVSTTAVEGEFWNFRTFFTGDGFSTAACADRNLTYEVELVEGAAPQTDGSPDWTIQLTHPDEVDLGGMPQDWAPLPGD